MPRLGSCCVSGGDQVVAPVRSRSGLDDGDMLNELTTRSADQAHPRRCRGFELSPRLVADETQLRSFLGLRPAAKAPKCGTPEEDSQGPSVSVSLCARRSVTLSEAPAGCGSSPARAPKGDLEGGRAPGSAPHAPSIRRPNGLLRPRRLQSGPICRSLAPKPMGPQSASRAVQLRPSPSLRRPSVGSPHAEVHGLRLPMVLESAHIQSLSLPFHLSCLRRDSPRLAKAAWESVEDRCSRLECSACRTGKAA